MKKYQKHKDFDNVIVLTPPKKKEVNILEEVAKMHLIRLRDCKERKKLTEAMDFAGLDEVNCICVDKVEGEYFTYQLKLTRV